MPPDWDDPRSIRRSDFTVVYPVPTRWSDVDYYGHVNNAIHYLVIDTAVNGWLMQATGTDMRTMLGMGVVAETSCRYLEELRFPTEIDVGIGLERVGAASVVYRLALFGSSPTPAATARFVHVYVDPVTRRPDAIPAGIRAVLAGLVPE